MLQTEIASIFANAPDISAVTAVLAKKAVVVACENSLTTSKKTLKPSGDCAICFESMEDSNELCEQCKICNNFAHEDCLSKWLKKSNTCVYCRSEWFLESESGYLNLASVQNDPQLSSSQRRAEFRRGNYYEQDW